MNVLLVILSLLFATPTTASPQGKELLGRKHFITKKVSQKEITHLLQQKLPKKYRARAGEFASVIIKESTKYKMDPYFILAVISGESSFNPEAKGPVSEIGFMQLRLGTGEWMSLKLKIKWNGEQTLKDPVKNIKLGVRYLAWLRERFNKDPQKYIAAYNMGEKNVHRAVQRKIIPKDYPRHVMKRYLAMVKE